MPRVRDPQRLRQLVQAATLVFIAQGYRRTQVADVAKAMGVGKGTVYLYVESKEALFDLAVRSAAEPEWVEPPELPVPTPPPGSTVRYISDRLASESGLAKLGEALACTSPADPEGELRGVLGELYDVLVHNRVVIKLIDRCAPDWPELADAFYSVARAGVLGAIAGYIRARQETGAFRDVGDVDVVARTFLEAVSFWAIHHHFDPSPSAVDEAAVRDTVVELITGALLP